jgi:hypothetical protein
MDVEILKLRGLKLSGGNFHGSSMEWDAACNAVDFFLKPHSNSLKDLYIDATASTRDVRPAEINKLFHALARCKFSGTVTFDSTNVPSLTTVLSKLTVETITALCNYAMYVCVIGTFEIPTPIQHATFARRTDVSFCFRSGQPPKTPDRNLQEDGFYGSVGHMLGTNTHIYKASIGIAVSHARAIDILKAVGSHNSSLPQLSVKIEATVPPQTSATINSIHDEWNGLWANNFCLKFVSFPLPDATFERDDYYIKTILLYSRLNFAGRQILRKPHATAEVFCDVLATMLGFTNRVTNDHASEDLSCTYLLLRQNLNLVCACVRKEGTRKEEKSRTRRRLY